MLRKEEEVSPRKKKAYKSRKDEQSFQAHVHPVKLRGCYMKTYMRRIHLNSPSAPVIAAYGDKSEFLKVWILFIFSGTGNLQRPKF